MIKYGKTGKFADVVYDIKSRHNYIGKDENGEPIFNTDTNYPTKDFIGTVKLHGTNCSIVKYKDRIAFQSRRNELSLTNDNHGFCNHFYGRDLDWLFEGIPFEEYIAVFGEWAGSGIQSGVGICNIPKSFFVFHIEVDGNTLHTTIEANPEYRVFDLRNMYTHQITVDFSNEESISAATKEIEDVLLQVEKECPIAKSFGFSGVGEGLVYRSEDRKFKVKGEKHTVVRSANKVSANQESLEGVKQFAEYALTEARLEQIFDKIKEEFGEVRIQNVPNFLRNLSEDVITEEINTIRENNLDTKLVNKYITNEGRNWFLQKIRYA